VETIEQVGLSLREQGYVADRVLATYAVYEWNYPRQMLEIRLLEARGWPIRRSGRSSARELMAAKPPPLWVIRLNTALLRRGFAVGTQWLLTVPGRRSGLPRGTPVSIAKVDDNRYIVAAFGDASWVKNVQRARAGILSRGKQTEEVTLPEVPTTERGPVLAAFLEQVRGGRRFFGNQSVDEIIANADLYPVFRIESPTPAGAKE
jgi:deazaflavin-dependent oxidoreductase (nitroreductase family)